MYLDDRSKIVIQYDNITALFCNFGSLDTHSEPDISLIDE